MKKLELKYGCNPNQKPASITVNDGRDLPHQGFQAFLKLIEKYHPRFFLHGHVHKSYGRQHKRYDKYLDTHVINAFERCVFDYEDDNLREHLKR